MSRVGSLGWIILAAGVFVASIAGLFRPSSSQFALEIETGDTLCLVDRVVDSSQSRTLVIATSETCGVCSSSAAFRDDLIAAAREKGVVVNILMPDSTEHDSLAGEFEGRGLSVFRADLASLGMSRVPAAYLLDNRNVVLSRWVGSVPPEREGFVLKSLFAGTPLQYYSRISREEFDSRIQESSSRQLFALERPGALLPRSQEYQVIPLSEIFVRAEYELSRDVATFVDCAFTDGPRSCQAAAFSLAVMGFTEVVAVGLPPRKSQCENV